jgi:UDP-N-acetylglucosamine diphosphorylase / glucose-1-phosphate thymidylyltransferase / UDP-N-acetylgalactosamine diphosphorylase / glucosamine-1-phosphate N-acetyltransferase / galactosamine-1-phosphate N-acetyltransferase
MKNLAQILGKNKLNHDNPSIDVYVTTPFFRKLRALSMSIVVFEDPQCELLAPITLARLAATMTCGSFRLVDLLSPLSQDLYGISRPHLQTLQRIDFPSLRMLEEFPADSPRQERSVKLLLNARIAPTKQHFHQIQKLVRMASAGSSGGRPMVVRDREHLAAVINPPWTVEQLFDYGYLGVEEWQSKTEGFDVYDCNLTTIAVPHELIACNMASIRENLEWRIELGQNQTDPDKTKPTVSPIREMSDGLFLADGATIGEYVLTDTKKGPIVIDRGAQVGPYTLLRGPIYIGAKARILEHSAIKDAVSLSHTTKIGGEVEASVVEPYSNKQHHGFLGHSYLGSWINLGAGTCNSDLKNTYGMVNMEYGFGKASTNMQFLGCIIGDYSKTAINTGIFTGKVIGVCSMMYGFVTSNVPSFVNYARLFGQMASLPPEVMVSTQQRMFARRDVQQRGCDVQLIYDMHRLTQMERDRFGDALAL